MNPSAATTEDSGDYRPPIRALLQEAAQQGIARQDAQILMLQALALPLHDRAWLITHDERQPAREQADRFRASCARRAAGEPVAYLVGLKEFHGLELMVDARVLVPRPDTETLVDWAIDCLDPTGHPLVLDLGTGSGAIALALAQACPQARVRACDRSEEALEVAVANARRLGLAVHFFQGDWLSGAPAGHDLIVSNPPYVAQGDPHLAALGFEPISALVAGPDGLDDIRRIIHAAPAHLLPGGGLLLEHGHDQAAAVRRLLSMAGFHQVTSRTDLAGIERVSGGFLPPVK